MYPARTGPYVDFMLGDNRCKRLMAEFQQRYPAVWAEDIGQA